MYAELTRLINKQKEGHECTADELEFVKKSLSELKIVSDRALIEDIHAYFPEIFDEVWEGI